MKKTQGVFLQAIESDATEAVIDVIGVIGWEVEYENLKGIIRSMPDTIERVVFDIYSPGGDVWEGNGIIQEIGGMKQHTVARIQLAASMATLLAEACDERGIAANGRFLIHNAWTSATGDASVLETRAKELRDCEDEAVAFYALRTGKEPDAIRELMNKETWLTPKEAVEWGFVTEINDPFRPDDYKAVRDEIRAAGKWPVALAEIPETEEEADHDDGDTEGAEGDEGGDTGGGDGSNVQEASIEEARLAGFADGQKKVNAIFVARAEAAECLLLKLKADAVELSGKLDASVAEARKFQGERDQARATVEKNAVAIDELTEKITRLLSGGLTFSPSVETWAQAMAACDGNYEKARKQFSDVYRAQRAIDKQTAGK